MRKNLVRYFASFILLAISFIMFILAFLYVSKGIYYILSGIFLTAFFVAYRLSERGVSCDGGYNLAQAYFFYKKCEKKGVAVKASKLKEQDMTQLRLLADCYDYGKALDENGLKELYRLGREAKNNLEKQRSEK